VPLLREKETVAPEARLPDGSTTVAVMEVRPKVLMDAGLATSVMPGVPLLVPTGAPALPPLMPEGEQPNTGPSRTTSPSITINLTCLIKTSKACFQVLLCCRGCGYV
jgi:hypothetical protein